MVKYLLLALVILTGCSSVKTLPEESMTSKDYIENSKKYIPAWLSKQELELAASLVDDFRKSKKSRENQKLLFYSAQTDVQGRLIFSYVLDRGEVFVVYIINPSSLVPLKRIITSPRLE